MSVSCGSTSWNRAAMALPVSRRATERRRRNSARYLPSRARRRSESYASAAAARDDQALNHQISSNPQIPRSPKSPDPNPQIKKEGRRSPPFFVSGEAGLPLLAALFLAALGCLLCHCLCPPLHVLWFAGLSTAPQGRCLLARQPARTAPSLRCRHRPRRAGDRFAMPDILPSNKKGCRLAPHPFFLLARDHDGRRVRRRLNAFPPSVRQAS